MSFIENTNKQVENESMNKLGNVNRAYRDSVYTIGASTNDLINVDSTNSLIRTSSVPSRSAMQNATLTPDSVYLEKANPMISSDSSLPNVNYVIPSRSISTDINSNNNSKEKQNICSTLVKRPCIFIPVIIFSCLVIAAILCAILYVLLHSANNNEKVSVEKIKNSSISIFASSQSLFSDPIASTTTTTTKPAAKCGVQKYQPNLQQLRIINGFKALPHVWPWTVSIGYYGPSNNVPHACGGTLINKRYVITATHCVLESSIYSLVGRPVKNSDTFGSLEQMMRVFVGVTTRSKDITPNNTYYVSKILSYPNFDRTTFKNDLTILKLTSDVQEDDNLSFICLTKDTVTKPGTDVVAVGWGFTQDNFFKASDTLNQVRLPIQGAATCPIHFLPSFQFCAGNVVLDKDTCNGDSGGPIMQQIDNRWVLTGIVSNGDALCSGKGVYTNVSFYYDWITENSMITEFGLR